MTGTKGLAGIRGAASPHKTRAQNAAQKSPHKSLNITGQAQKPTHKRPHTIFRIQKAAYYMAGTKGRAGIYGADPLPKSPYFEICGL